MTGDSPSTHSGILHWFGLTVQRLVETRTVDWGYNALNGPNMWANLTDLYRKCSSGNLQSPIDIRSSDVYAKLNRFPPLRWDLSNASGGAVESYDGRTFVIAFANGPPRITTLDFSRYLDIVPLDAVARTTYTLQRIVLHTPSENLLEGVR
jgi:carbonic anhydrase